MFKKGKPSETKQRFTIRKYHFGAASVLLGTFFSIGAGVASAEEKLAETARLQSEQVTTAPPATTEADILPVVETTSVAATTEKVVETTEAPVVNTTAAKQAETREVTITYLVKYVDAQGKVVKTEEKTAQATVTGESKAQTFVTVDGKLVQVVEGEKNEFTVNVKSEDKKEEAPVVQEAEKAASVELYKYTVEYVDQTTKEVLKREEKTSQEANVSVKAEQVIVAKNRPYDLATDQKTVQDILLNHGEQENKAVFYVTRRSAAMARPKNEGQAIAREGAGFRLASSYTNPANNISAVYDDATKTISWNITVDDTAPMVASAGVGLVFGTGLTSPTDVKINGKALAKTTATGTFDSVDFGRVDATRFANFSTDSVQVGAGKHNITFITPVSDINNAGLELYYGKNSTVTPTQVALLPGGYTATQGKQVLKLTDNELAIKYAADKKQPAPQQPALATLSNGFITKEHPYITVTPSRYYIPIGAGVVVTRESNVRIIATGTNGREIVKYEPPYFEYNGQNANQNKTYTLSQAFGLYTNEGTGYITTKTGNGDTDFTTLKDGVKTNGTYNEQGGGNFRDLTFKEFGFRNEIDYVYTHTKNGKK